MNEGKETIDAKMCFIEWYPETKEGRILIQFSPVLPDEVFQALDKGTVKVVADKYVTSVKFKGR